MIYWNKGYFSQLFADSAKYVSNYTVESLCGIRAYLGENDSRRNYLISLIVWFNYHSLKPR